MFGHFPRIPFFAVSAAIVLGCGSLAADEAPDEPAGAERPAEPERNPKAADDAWIRFGTPGLRFEQSRFAEEARLLLREGDEVSWRVHRGRDLEAILSVNPDLATRREVLDLQRHLRSATEEVAVGADRTPAAGFRSEIRTFVEAPGLLLERRGPNETWLFVDDSAGGERVFIAKDLAALVTAHPNLESTVGFPTLRAKLREIDARRPLTLKPDAMAIVDVRHSDAQVALTAFTRTNGRWTSKTFRGNSLDEVTTREMELRRILDLPPTTIQSAGSSRSAG